MRHYSISNYHTPYGFILTEPYLVVDSMWIDFYSGSIQYWVRMYASQEAYANKSAAIEFYTAISNTAIFTNRNDVLNDPLGFCYNDINTILANYKHACELYENDPNNYDESGALIPNPELDAITNLPNGFEILLDAVYHTE